MADCMESLTYPRFVVHDVLQRTAWRRPQRISIMENGPFAEQFRRNMKPWEGYPATLLVLAEGCGQTDWVNYIKDHPEWSVQCHGWKHLRYDALPEHDCENLLRRAKETIECTFRQPVTQYYPPFNKYNDMTQRVANKLGMEEMRRLRKPGYWKKNMDPCWQTDFHYWARDVVLARVIHFYHAMQPTFIIGAPRSGTTALMRWYGKHEPDALVLKEVERPWHQDQNMRRWYAEKLGRSDRNSLIDKNCRNSMRICDIQMMFPEAQFIHVIRDGRAVANSWKNWAIKTKKADRSIEGAAKQWLAYVGYVRKNRKHLKNYRELRYEQMCEKFPEYFKSRNGKWKKTLSDHEIGVVTKIQGPLLTELGYL